MSTMLCASTSTFEGDKRTREVGQLQWMRHRELEHFRASWSADSRWLAFHRYTDNGHRAVFLYDADRARLHQVTSGFYDDFAPTFDPGGAYLYLLTNRDLSPIYSDLQDTWIYANTTRIAAVALRTDVPSPLAAAQRRRRGGRQRR